MGFCAVWSSNALGQLLEEKDSLSFAGWEREEKENLAILYFDGKEMWRKETLEDGERILEENVETRLFFSEDGRILRKTVDDGENFAEYNYNYSSSLSISSSTLSLDGVVVERVSYTLSPDGVLLSMEKDGNPIYFTQDRMVRSGEDGVESYLYSEDNDGDVEWLESGGYRENTPSGYKEYDGNGRLILSYENGISTCYS